MNLGNELVDHDLAGPTRAVADYLFLSSATTASPWLAAAQRESSDPQSAAPSADPTAVAHLGFADWGLVTKWWPWPPTTRAVRSLLCGAALYRTAANGRSRRPAVPPDRR